MFLQSDMMKNKWEVIFASAQRGIDRKCMEHTCPDGI